MQMRLNEVQYDTKTKRFLKYICLPDGEKEDRCARCEYNGGDDCGEIVCSYGTCYVLCEQHEINDFLINAYRTNKAAIDLKVASEPDTAKSYVTRRLQLAVSDSSDSSGDK